MDTEDPSVGAQEDLEVAQEDSVAVSQVDTEDHSEEVPQVDTEDLSEEASLVDRTHQARSEEVCVVIYLL